MDAATLVGAFYERIWNAGDLCATAELLGENFVFRGSLGDKLSGREPFKDYVRSVRSSLAEYRCEILDCVAEGNRAFAKMCFSGIHVSTFRGFAATGRPVHWLGAALFHCKDGVIVDLWVLGDLAGLDAVLEANRLAERKGSGPE